VPSCCSLVVPVAMGRTRRRFGGMAPEVRGVRQDAGVSLFGVSLLEVWMPRPGGPAPARPRPQKESFMLLLPSTYLPGTVLRY